MEFELMGVSGSAMQQLALSEVLACNRFTAPYGLMLTEQQAVALVEVRGDALIATGRIEFGGGVIDKLIRAFCGSPYLSNQNFSDTIGALMEVFYDYKNDTMDGLSDDELIEAMQVGFDGICQGSVELLSGRELERLARNVRSGRRADADAESRAPELAKEDMDGDA